MLIRPCAVLALLLPSVLLADEASTLKPGEKAGDVWKGNSLGIKFRWCPPGNFTMGSPATEEDRSEDENQVPVILSRGFYLGQHEVTQAEWETIMGTTPWKGQANVRQGENYPVVSVSWDEATGFCEKLTVRGRSEGWLPKDWRIDLPTEAQWEYACRAGKGSRYSFGDDESRLSEYAWWGGILGGGNSKNERYAHQVGQKKPNPWGLSDIHGNVWEWCRDWYVDKLPGETDPDVQEHASLRVVRGGCWGNVSWLCRSAFRYACTPDSRLNGLGFRVALVQTR